MVTFHWSMFAKVQPFVAWKRGMIKAIMKYQFPLLQKDYKGNDDDDGKNDDDDERNDDDDEGNDDDISQIYCIKMYTSKK